MKGRNYEVESAELVSGKGEITRWDMRSMEVKFRESLPVAVPYHSFD